MLSFSVSLPFALGGLLLAGGSAGVASRIAALERSELEQVSVPRSLATLRNAPGSTRVSARLAELQLRAGELATFELCAQDALAPERFRGAFDLVVWELSSSSKAPPSLMLRVPLDDAHLALVRRGRDRACLPLGAGRIPASARYALDAVYPGGTPQPEVLLVPLQARVLARTPLAPSDRWYVLALAFGALLLLLALGAAGAGDAPARSVLLAPQGPLTGAAIALLVIFGASQVETAGSATTFGKGLLLSLLQGMGAVLLARWLLGAGIASALGWRPPPARLRWLLVAVASAALLVLTAKAALELVPATGEAPIQTFVSWPSGLLSFAALGVLLPIGEELFFRGYLYRAALALGSAAAFAISSMLFVALHAHQSWGNWGGLVAISFAGLVLTALRAASGSLLPPLLAHLLYNLALSLRSL